MAILDDSYNMGDLQSHLVKTTYMHGLSLEDTEKVISMLNKTL